MGHLVEVRDWSASRYDQIKSGTLSVFMQAVQGVHKTTSLVVGSQRSTYLLSTLRLPIAEESEDDRNCATLSCIMDHDQCIDMTVLLGTGHLYSCGVQFSSCLMLQAEAG